jgi:hypothetical protein
MWRGTWQAACAGAHLQREDADLDEVVHAVSDEDGDCNEVLRSRSSSAARMSNVGSQVRPKEDNRRVKTVCGFILSTDLWVHRAGRVYTQEDERATQQSQGKGTMTLLVRT